MQKEKEGVPEMRESLAREMGSSNHPLLSLAIGEGNPEPNLTRLALESLDWLHFFWASSLLMEKREGEEECWSRRETHVRKRKIERRKGKAWGFLRK